MHGITAVFESDRGDPVAGVGREIAQRMCTAVRLGVRDHRLGQFAVIERLALGRGDLGERRRQSGRGENLADGGRSAPRQEVLGESGHGAQDGHGLRPLVGDDRGYRITVARALDRRCE